MTLRIFACPECRCRKFVSLNALNVHLARSHTLPFRIILNQKGKRTQQNTLFNQYHYTMKSTDSTISIGFEFGDAEDYWEFVDQGVVGVGGFKGSGNARGQGSEFKFKYANPGGAMVNAIQSWIKNKPISIGDMNEQGLAWAIGYSIKRRGLERTMFYSRPVQKRLIKLPEEIKEAFRLDVGSLIGKLPSKIYIEENLTFRK